MPDNPVPANHRRRVHLLAARVLVGLASAASLAACAPPVRYADPLTAELRGVDFIPVPNVPLYCYRTLAEIDCYGTPQPLPPNRYIVPYPPEHVL